MEFKITDTKENENKERELVVPVLGASNLNDGDHPVSPPLQQHPSSPSPVPMEANSITYHTGHANAGSNIQPHSTPAHHSTCFLPVSNDQSSPKPDVETTSNVKSESSSIFHFKTHTDSTSDHIQAAEATTDVKTETSSVSPPKLTENAKTETSSALTQSKTNYDCNPIPTCLDEPEPLTPSPLFSDMELLKEKVGDLKNGDNKTELPTTPVNGNNNSELSFFLDDIHFSDGNESGTEKEQSVFMKQLEIFFKERGMEFKPPKFYGEGLNCLNFYLTDIYTPLWGIRLWRAVTKLGGYDK
ncbi:hypothetical protein Goari_018956, partial [Gossypium aridum]|nr:hypothetical protein [Gossypium aridum]